MKKSELLKTSLINALLTIIYVFLVALLIWKANDIFGTMNNFLGPFAFLLLFTLSAAIVGSLIIGKPIFLYLDGQKKEAVMLLLYTIAWLFIATVIALLIQLSI
jgi:preprotein translocase subunit SecF